MLDRIEREIAGFQEANSRDRKRLAAEPLGQDTRNGLLADIARREGELQALQRRLQGSARTE